MADESGPTTTSGPPTKRPRLEYEQAMAFTVLVGAEETKFIVHQGPIEKISGFFKAAFEGRFKEHADGVIKLPTFKSEIFNQFLGYAYSGSPNMATLRPLNRGLEDRDMQLEALPPVEQEDRWMQLSELYVLSDYLEALKLKNLIISMLYIQITTYKNNEVASNITPKVINYIYANTVRGSGIRQLMASQAIWASEYESVRKSADALEDLDEHLNDFHEEFLAELAATSMRRVWDKKTRDPFKSASPSQYHDSEEGSRGVVSKAKQPKVV